MNRQQLIDGISDLDPSFAQFVNWDNHTDEALQICYDRKNDAPQAVKDRMKKYGNNTPYQEPARSYDSDVPVSRRVEQPRQESVSLTGFDALKKE